MTWFDRAALSRPKPAIFSDRTKRDGSVPSWIGSCGEHGPSGGAARLVRPVSVGPALPGGHPHGASDALSASEIEGRVAAERLEEIVGERVDAALAVQREQVEREMERERVGCLSAMRAAAEQLTGCREQVVRDSEAQLVELAAAIAKRVLGRELATDPSWILALAHEGVEALGERDRVTVRLGVNPGEADVREFVERIKMQVGACTVVVDSTLEPGACVVESDFGHVDESVQARLDNVVRSILSSSG